MWVRVRAWERDRNWGIRGELYLEGEMLSALLTELYYFVENIEKASEREREREKEKAKWEKGIDESYVSEITQKTFELNQV